MKFGIYGNFPKGSQVAKGIKGGWTFNLLSYIPHLLSKQVHLSQVKPNQANMSSSEEDQVYEDPQDAPAGDADVGAPVAPERPRKRKKSTQHRPFRVLLPREKDRGDFILAWQSLPILYNKSSPDYHKEDLKTKARLFWGE